MNCDVSVDSGFIFPFVCWQLLNIWKYDFSLSYWSCFDWSSPDPIFITDAGLRAALKPDRKRCWGKGGRGLWSFCSQSFFSFSNKTRFFLLMRKINWRVRRVCARACGGGDETWRVGPAGGGGSHQSAGHHHHLLLLLLTNTLSAPPGPARLGSERFPQDQDTDGRTRRPGTGPDEQERDLQDPCSACGLPSCWAPSRWKGTRLRTGADTTARRSVTLRPRYRCFHRHREGLGSGSDRSGSAPDKPKFKRKILRKVPNI